MKKLLALVLALVMTLSLCTISNAAFSDAKDIDYTEAVEVMSAVKILEGDEKGAFLPNGTLTREQAAKIICTMLLGETAKKLSASGAPFADVSATRWSAPYIAYCASNGIVDGVGNGNFDPAGKLTGHAFGKMLLTALEIKGEYTGSNWAINVAVALVDNKLNDGLDSVILSNELSRQEAAQMAYNGLFFSATTEEKDVYTITAGNVAAAGAGIDTVDGEEFDSFSEAYLVATNAKTGADTFTITKSTVEVKKDSLADDVFSLVKNTRADEFMRPTAYYTSTAKAYKDMDVSANDAADYVIEGAIKAKDLYSKLGYKAAKDYTWSNYVDGVAVAGDDNFHARPGKTTTTNFQNTANGTVSYVYIDNDDKTVTFSVVNTYVGEVKKVTDAKDGDDRYVTLTNGEIFETEDFAKKDVVLYTKSNKITTAPATEGIQSMELAKVVSGKLTKYTTGTSTVWTIDGTDYKLSAKGTSAITDNKLNKDVSVYVDAQGFIMKDKSAAATTKDYILVLANGAVESTKTYKTGVTKSVEVYGVTSAGEEVTFTCSSVGEDITGVTANKNTIVGSLFTYETDDNGLYELTKVNNTQPTGNIAVRATKTTTAAGDFVINSATQFIFVEQKGNGDATVKNITVKTGNAAIGTTIVNTTADVAAEDGVAKYVFVSREFVDESTDSGEVVWVDASTKKTSTAKEDGKTTTTYTYDAYGVDGKLTVTSTTVNLGEEEDALYKLNDDNTITTAVTGVLAGEITAIDGNVVTVTAADNVFFPEDEGDAVDVLYLNVVDGTDEIYTNEDAALAVGQTVAFKRNTTKDTNLDAIVVTADQVTYTLTLTDNADGATCTTTAYEVIGGTYVVNTVKIVAAKAAGTWNADKAITLAIAAVGGQAVVGTVTPTAATATVTFEVTVTAPAANQTITVNSVTQAAE